MPKLTAKQEKQFKKLYLKGLSARYIFQTLGVEYDSDGHGPQNATSRMGNYAKKLGLPKRGKGFKSVWSPDVQEKARSKHKEVLKRKIASVQKSILLAEKQLPEWKKHLSNLEKELSIA